MDSNDCLPAISLRFRFSYRFIYHRHHVTPLLRDYLHWLRARERISFKLCILVNKAIHGLAPCYLTRCVFQFPLFPTFLLSVPLLVVIWSYPEQGYNSATVHFVWLVRSPAAVYQSTTGHSFGTYIINVQKHSQDFCGALVVTLAMLLRRINCLIIIIIITVS